MYYVYILKSEKTGKYYTGYSANIGLRLIQHNIGKTASTRFGCPWVVVHTEEFPDRKSAWLRERQIKKYKGGNAFKKLLSSSHGGVA